MTPPGADGRAGELSVFRHRVRDLVKRPPVTCRAEAPVIAVARRLSREGVGSIVVVGDDGEPVGIVTDRDLRRKVAWSALVAFDEICGERLIVGHGIAAPCCSS